MNILYSNILYLYYWFLFLLRIFGTPLHPPPAFRPKNRLFLRNLGCWFRILTSFAPQTSSFGDICIFPPSEICTRSTRTSWSCTPWSNFFLIILRFMRVLRVMRVYVGYLLWCMGSATYKDWGGGTSDNINIQYIRYTVYRGGARILVWGEHQKKFHIWIPFKSCTAMASPKFRSGENIQHKSTHQRLLKNFEKFIKIFAQKFKISPKFFNNKI